MLYKIKKQSTLLISFQIGLIQAQSKGLAENYIPCTLGTHGAKAWRA